MTATDKTTKQIRRRTRWKKAATVLLITLLTLMLLYGVFVAVWMNWHYIVDLRAVADGHEHFRIEIEHLEDGVRVSFPYTDNYVVFSDDRECVEAQGITPIEFNHRNMRGYDGYEDFAAEYGPHHYDLGSGVFWPVYVTSDGYLLVMWNPGDHRWREVWMDDLLADQ